MRKIGLLWAILPLLFLTGCSNSNVPKVEDYDWVMTSVQSMDAKGQATAGTLSSGKPWNLYCKAENGCLTFTDQTNHKICTGTYHLTQKDPQSSIYKVRMDGKDGMAVVAMTTYHDGSQDPTFIINLGDYTINLFAR